MSIRTRIILSFLLIFSISFYFFVDWILDDLELRYRESTEEPLVDMARILASVLATQAGKGAIPTDDFRSAFENIYRESFSAKIYDMVVTHVDLRVYVTDDKGIVIFDSDGGKDEGKDYSRWNDVYLTLRGEYGARTTRVVPDDPASSILYVAAPIKVNGEIVGALTVCKTKEYVNIFIRRAKRKIIAAGVMAALIVILLGILLSVFFTRPLNKLTRYVRAIRDGARVSLPRLGRNEIGMLGESLEEMRDALEGKKYVEQYVQTLAHEVKSPLSAALGSAELLEEEMPPERRARFLANIRSEIKRVQDIIDRLLQLSSLESRKGLEKVEEIDLAEVAGEVTESMSSLVLAKKISIINRAKEPALIRGERFLVRQAVSNLLRNAIDFAPAGGEIRLSVRPAGNGVSVVVEDNGPGIPDYALEKIFRKFYSLQRPDAATKGSGLGLSFVREVALLHGGEATLENRPEGGARATLHLPRDRSLRGPSHPFSFS